LGDAVIEVLDGSSDIAMASHEIDAADGVGGVESAMAG